MFFKYCQFQFMAAFIMSQCHCVRSQTFAIFCNFFQILPNVANFCQLLAANIMSPRHHVIMSSCHLVIMLPCHPAILSPCQSGSLQMPVYRCQSTDASLQMVMVIVMVMSICCSLWASELVSLSGCATWNLRACFFRNIGESHLREFPGIFRNFDKLLVISISAHCYYLSFKSNCGPPAR